MSRENAGMGKDKGGEGPGAEVAAQKVPIDYDGREESKGGEGPGAEVAEQKAPQRRGGFYAAQPELPRLYPEGSKCKSVQEIKETVPLSLGEGLSFIPLEEGDAWLDSESGQKPKKHQHIIAKLDLEKRTGLSGFVSKASFSALDPALDPLAKKYLEKSYDYCQKKHIDLTACTVEYFVERMIDSLTYRIENISDERGQGGRLVANLLAVDNKAERERESENVSKPANFTRSARFNSQAKMERVLKTGLIQEEQSLQEFIQRGDLGKVINAAVTEANLEIDSKVGFGGPDHEQDAIDVKAIKRFLEQSVNQAPGIVEEYGAEETKGEAPSSAEALTLKQALLVNYILQQNGIHLSLDINGYSRKAAAGTISHNKFKCSTHLVSAMDSDKQGDEPGFWQDLDESYKQYLSLDSDLVALNKADLLLTESSHSSWAAGNMSSGRIVAGVVMSATRITRSRGTDIKKSKRNDQLDARMTQLKQQIYRTDGHGFSKSFVSFVTDQQADIDELLKGDQISGAERVFLDYYKAVTNTMPMPHKGEYDALYGNNAFTFEMGDIAFAELANMHEHVSCKSGQDRTLTQVATRLAIAKCGWLTDALQKDQSLIDAKSNLDRTRGATARKQLKKGITAREKEIKADYKVKFTAEFFKVIAKQGKEVVEYARGAGAPLKFQLGSKISAQPIPTAFYGHVESDLGTAKAVEAHWEREFPGTQNKTALVEERSLSLDREADLAVAGPKKLTLTTFKEGLQTVKMPAGRFKAYVMKERFAEIFQNKAASTLGVDITSIEAFYTKGQSTGKKGLLEAFEYLVELNNQLESREDLSAEELAARKIALAYFKQKVEEVSLGSRSRFRQFRNSYANKVKSVSGLAYEAFQPETQKLKELYELGYSNVSDKLSKMKSNLEATYNLQTNTLAGAAEPIKYFEKQKDGKLAEKVDIITFEQIFAAVLDENNLDLAVTLCKAKPDQMTQLSKEVKQQFLESLFEDYRFEDLKSVIKAGVDFAECEIETIKVFSKEDEKQLKSIRPTLERRGVKFTEIVEVDTSASPHLLAADVVTAAAKAAAGQAAAEAAALLEVELETGEQYVSLLGDEPADAAKEALGKSGSRPQSLSKGSEAQDRVKRPSGQDFRSQLLRSAQRYEETNEAEVTKGEEVGGPGGRRQAALAAGRGSEKKGAHRERVEAERRGESGTGGPGR